MGSRKNIDAAKIIDEACKFINSLANIQGVPDVKVEAAAYIAKLNQVRGVVLTPDNTWEGMRLRVNALHMKLQEKPLSEKLGYSNSPGGILNAYREGDIPWGAAIAQLNDLINEGDHNA